MRRVIKTRNFFGARNVLLGAFALTFVVEKASAQVQPSLPSKVINGAISGSSSAGATTNGGIANLAQLANVSAADGINAQMRAGTDVVIRSELFVSICTVALLFAIFMLVWQIIKWLMACALAETFVLFSPVEVLPPLLLAILLSNPVGQGFALQNIVVGTTDLLNSSQSYILKNGGKATQPGGSAVRQATGKTQAEQSIRAVQLDCASTLDQSERKTCYQDGYNSVEALLDEFRSAQWAQRLSTYAGKVLLQEGKNSDKLTNVGGAISGVASAAGIAVLDSAADLTAGILSPALYAGLLMASTAFGIVIGYIQLLSMLFFPLSISFSFAPPFEGSWVLWFKGMFQIWLSGLFLRILVTVSAIITISGTSVSGGLYVVATAIIALVCLIMSIASIISTIFSISNNVVSNVANLR